MALGLGNALPFRFVPRGLAQAIAALLDLYPNAAAAYSTRLLSNAYSGSPLRVRRAADNVEVDVPFGQNMALGTTDMEGFLRSYTGGFGTNLLLYSEEFDNAAWTKFATAGASTPTITANAAASPIGTLTADLIAINRGSVTSGSFLVQQRSIAAGRHASSLWVRAKDASYVGKTIDFWQFDGAVKNRFGHVLTLDWNRVTPPNPIALGGGSNEMLSFGYLDAGSLSPDTGLIEFYAWGAQGEAGTTATTYDYKRDTANTSAFVTTWYDQSGNARNATQATAANQPRIVNAGVVDKANGRVSLYHAVNPNFLTVPAFSNVSMFGALFTNDTAARALAQYANDNGQFLGAYTAGDNSNLLSSGVGSPVYYVNGTSYASGTNTRGQLSAAIRGALRAISAMPIANINSSTPHYYTQGGLTTIGYYPEWIVYPTDQSANRAAIESNIISYYAITGAELAINAAGDMLAVNANNDTLGVN